MGSDHSDRRRDAVSRETAREDVGRLESLPVCEFANPGPLRDQLVEAVLSGAKTATTGLLEEYGDEPLPTVGARFRVIDSEGADVAVIETVEVRVLRMADVDLGFAVDEGEGFETLEAWRAAHERFWLGDDIVTSLGIVLDDDTLVVAERFRRIS